MNNMTTFYLARHGETEHNVNHIVQGHLDSPLTEKGEEQAKLLGEEFKNIDFDLIFSSDLLRAKRTAEIVRLEKELAVETTEALRERNWGQLEGQNSSAFDKYDPVFNALSDEMKKTYKPVDQYETDEEVTARILTFLRETAITYPGKKILVVSHGGTIRALLVHLGYGTYGQLGHGALRNGGWVKLETDGVDFFIKEVNGLTMKETNQYA